MKKGKCLKNEKKNTKRTQKERDDGKIVTIKIKNKTKNGKKKLK
jgi:hypothetical protein